MTIQEILHEALNVCCEPTPYPSKLTSPMQESIASHRKEEERKRIAKEKYDKSHEVFAVTFVKYATIYVHATSEQQAREICEKHDIYPDDYGFDGAEIERIEYESNEYHSYIDKVYDEDGDEIDAEVFFDDDE